MDTFTFAIAFFVVILVVCGILHTMSNDENVNGVLTNTIVSNKRYVGYKCYKRNDSV